ncbi:tRNA (adenosine(37)-N6)-threonylcarbamoyltransferase complex transferase subunit TsaD [Oenococcus kitaharae]|uniref:tRNA (adenosine(37)-N6)-threonylcarbamoyltransferase complex transferase subunit TsaD n=1 Tax=Oenococcus TaxID=46254 RepID=UPI0021E7EA01|nr:tRNA (adenosine(37)-N6)-threonylcarbamoyltransferase complex transferase subunit TsaD [Oenococcus kitaharae]MCV3296686.1 tRNA (adenosine(37)-N6)-threonylcarbamoyltransferase complex transferase subunit TsaD [Oenococcus kitaharae]
MTAKQDNLILAFESSADETSAAVVKNGHEILSNIVATQIASHQRFGGIVPEVASRHHLEWINRVTKEALQEASITNPAAQLSAVAATYGPGLVGSLLIGLMAGKTFAMVHGLPFIAVNHLAGHISAANFVQPTSYPAMAVMVSGGHTELLWMAKENSFQIIGTTLDDAAGEAFDKVGRILGLNYPAGKEMQEMAAKGQANIHFPIAHTENTFDFSFSGLKSSVLNYVHHADQLSEQINKNDVAASFQKAVVEAIIEKTEAAIQVFQPVQLLLGGGVAANLALRTAIEHLAQTYHLKLTEAPISLAGDNAAMIGAAAYLNFKAGRFSGLDLNTDPSLNFSRM